MINNLNKLALIGLLKENIPNISEEQLHIVVEKIIIWNNGIVNFNLSSFINADIPPLKRNDEFGILKQKCNCDKASTGIIYCDNNCLRKCFCKRMNSGFVYCDKNCVWQTQGMDGK